MSVRREKECSSAPITSSSFCRSFTLDRFSVSPSHPAFPFLPFPFCDIAHSVIYCSTAVSWGWRAGEDPVIWGRSTCDGASCIGGKLGIAEELWLWIFTCSYLQEMDLWHLWSVQKMCGVCGLCELFLIATDILSNVDLFLWGYQLVWCITSHWDVREDFLMVWKLRYKAQQNWQQRHLLPLTATETGGEMTGLNQDRRRDLWYQTSPGVVVSDSVAAVKVRQTARQHPIHVFCQRRDLTHLTSSHTCLGSVYEIILSPHLLRNTSLQTHQPTHHLLSPWSLSKSERSSTDLCGSQQPESDSSALEIESSKKRPRYFWTIFAWNKRSTMWNQSGYCNHIPQAGYPFYHAPCRYAIITLSALLLPVKINDLSVASHFGAAVFKVRLTKMCILGLISSTGTFA